MRQERFDLPRFGGLLGLLRQANLRDVVSLVMRTREGGSGPLPEMIVRPMRSPERIVT